MFNSKILLILFECNTFHEMSIKFKCEFQNRIPISSKDQTILNDDFGNGIRH